MDNKYLLALLLFLPLAVYADTLDCRGDVLVQEKAAESFTLLSSALSRITSLSASFKQTSYLAALDISEDSSGNIWYAKPAQLKWEYRNPEQQTYLLHNHELRHYNKTDNILTIKNIEQEVSSKIPLLILFGEQEISAGFILEKACVSEGKTDYILKPKQLSQEDPIDKIRVSIESDYQVSILGILEKTGNRNIFLFSEKRYNQQHSANAFGLDIPGNADVNDLRGKNE